MHTVRRKFLRQNRDIARDNSAKSLRIRNLENEVSRLLAENLRFREQIAHLENEVSVSKNRRIIDHINLTKSNLELKLVEMMTLVQEMKHVPATKRRSSFEPRKVETRSPGSKAQRNMAIMSEALADQEGRLPPILENKHYPRKTLEYVDSIHYNRGISNATTVARSFSRSFRNKLLITPTLPILVHHLYQTLSMQIR